jgi:outer membrane protein OmpA-like peptidoglycan-associated protein
VATENKAFDAVEIPAGPKEADLARLEGRITRLFYLAPAGRSVLEVQRNYEQALEKAGATRRDACAMPACGAPRFDFVGIAQGKQLAAGKVDGWGAQSLVDQWNDAASVRWWYGTLDARGTTLHVAVMSSRQGLVGLGDKHVATVVQVVQPEAMETGKVTVDAAALTRGLLADGRIALYGILFDTGRAEIKPESAPQLAEMAKLQQGQPALRVHIVGHTDNQGTLEANLALSRARAQAVADALAKTHRIDPKHLGVASYAPVASNAAEAGRAKNRRVELVVQ